MKRFFNFLKWAWNTKMFRYTVIAFAILLAFLIIRDVNYEKWYGEEETTTELVEPTTTIDTLKSE